MKKAINAALILMVTFSMIAATSCKKIFNKVDNSLSALKERGVFVLGLDDSFPPLGFRNEDNEIVGYDIDLAKEVAARLEVDFKAQPIDWVTKERELKTGKIDCIWNGFTITDERAAVLSFTKPYLNNEQVLVVREDSGINTLTDMKGKTVGIQSGSSAQAVVNDCEEFLSSLANKVMFRDNITALNDLDIGGIDGVVMDSVVVNYSIAQSKKAFKVVEEALANEVYAVAFRKSDVQLCNEVQKILLEMQADGTVATISQKWFGRDISIIGR